jgi:acyl carrier protein
MKSIRLRIDRIVEDKVSHRWIGLVALDLPQVSGGDRLMTIRESIISQIQQIAEERDKRALPRLTDDLIVLESGLDSLELAILVARLEDELGIDPFSSADEVDFPITFGDFVRLYENARPRPTAELTKLSTELARNS